MAAESLSAGTVASPLQGFQTLVSNLHTDVTLDDVMVSSAAYSLPSSADQMNVQLFAVILPVSYTHLTLPTNREV